MLEAGHGICFAKSHLLAALLRCKSVPTGYCFQKLILDDETAPILVYHGLNGVYIKELKKWIRLDARRMTGECKEPDKYDDQINSWYERALKDENEEIRHHAADSLFGFYLRKKNYTMAEKNGTLSAVFDMGKYNEYVPMLNIVCAEKDVEGTYQVVEQLLESVDSLYDFSKSKLYRHKKFKDTDGSYLQVIKEKLLEGFRNEKDFSFMKGYEPWENLL